MTVAERKAPRPNRKSATAPANPTGFGMTVEPLTRDRARELGVAATSGVVVADVQSGGRAADAGLRAGDVIVEVDRQTGQRRRGPARGAEERVAAGAAAGPSRRARASSRRSNGSKPRVRGRVVRGPRSTRIRSRQARLQRTVATRTDAASDTPLTRARASASRRVDIRRRSSRRRPSSPPVHRAVSPPRQSMPRRRPRPGCASSRSASRIPSISSSSVERDDVVEVLAENLVGQVERRPGGDALRQTCRRSRWSRGCRCATSA